ncbi:hypothetical protein [Macrococcus capreoli]|uniref:hypothetical protein n=1 Tax=Macrococcus capreoli TaxID=2982690 RepID=UPI003EE59DED
MSLSKETILDNFKQKVIPEVLIPKYTNELREQLKSVLPNQLDEINKLEYIYSDESRSELIVKGDFEQSIRFSYKPEEDLEIVSKDQLYFYLRNSQKVIQVQLEDINYCKGDIVIGENDFVKSFENNKNNDNNKLMFIKASEFTDEEKLMIKIWNKELLLKRVAYDSAEFAKLEYIDEKNRYRIVLLIKYDFSDIKLKFSLNLTDNSNGWSTYEILEVLNIYKEFMKHNIYINGTNKVDVEEIYNERLEVVKDEISNFEKIEKLEEGLKIKFTIKYPYKDMDMNTALLLYKGLILKQLIYPSQEIENILINNPNFDLEKNKNTKFILCQYSKKEKVELWGAEIAFEYAEYIVDLEYYDYEAQDDGFRLLMTEEAQNTMTIILQYSKKDLVLIKERERLLQNK